MNHIQLLQLEKKLNNNFEAERRDDA